MDSVAVQVDNVHFALPVLLHVVCEHGVKDGGSRGKDILVATELATLAGHNAVGKLALRKTKLNLPYDNNFIPTDSKMLEMSRESRETGSVARPVFPFTGLIKVTTLRSQSRRKFRF